MKTPALSESIKPWQESFATIRAVLEGGLFKPEQTFELQGLGIILADAIASEMRMAS